MVARLSARIVFLAVAVALVFFGVGLFGLAIAAALAPLVGAAAGDAITGAILLFPPLLWAIIVTSTRPARSAMPPPSAGLMGSLFAAVAKESPWIAIVGAGLAGAADMFLNRNKPKK